MKKKGTKKIPPLAAGFQEIPPSRPLYTAAELVRRSQASTKGEQLPTDSIQNGRELMSSSSGSVRGLQSQNEAFDLDDEIQRLEEELRRNDDDDDDSDENDDSVLSGSTSNKSETLGPFPTAPSILSLSKHKEAAIQSLPVALLPTIKKRKLTDGNNDVRKEMKSKRARKDAAENKTSEECAVSEGLKSAVQELLRGYKPRSAERLPFYCRVCARQFENENSFVAHKKEEFHTTAAAMERKASLCKLCRKSFTSPAQLQEHLRSKPHKEQLSAVQTSQRQQPNNNKRGPHNNHRQWK